MLSVHQQHSSHSRCCRQPSIFLHILAYISVAPCIVLHCVAIPCERGFRPTCKMYQAHQAVTRTPQCRYRRRFSHCAVTGFPNSAFNFSVDHWAADTQYLTLTHNRNPNLPKFSQISSPIVIATCSQLRQTYQSSIDICILIEPIVTSAKEVMFSSLFVCLFVFCLLATLRKYFQTDLH